MSEERSAPSAPVRGQGESAFLRGVYERYWRELCRYLRARFGGGPPEPQDIAQHAFAQLAGLGDPQSIRNPRAFLYRTAINAAIDHRRTLRRHDRLLSGTGSPEAAEDVSDLGPERVLLGQEQLRILEAAVMALPERDRTFLLLNRFEEMSFAEIARQTGLSPSGVRLIVQEALAKCQAALTSAERKRAPERSRGHE